MPNEPSLTTAICPRTGVHVVTPHLNVATKTAIRHSKNCWSNSCASEGIQKADSSGSIRRWRSSFSREDISAGGRRL